MAGAREQAREVVFDYCQNDRRSHSVKDYADKASDVWEPLLRKAVGMLEAFRDSVQNNHAFIVRWEDVDELRKALDG